MARTATLTAGLVAKKGEAMPASIVHPTQPIPSSGPATVLPAKAVNPSTDYYKSLTVKLDRARYEALKGAGVKLDKKSQEIFVEALDLWLQKQTASAA